MADAWVFPGQGSQKLGMAQEVLSLPSALERFEFASKLIGRDLLKICDGIDPAIQQPNDLNDTRNTQPALFIVESLLVDAIQRQSQNPSILAGHSLGEIVALYAAGVFDFKTALILLKSRSELMAAAADGSMTAIIGFDRNELNLLLNDFKEVVIANDNSKAQVVLSGAPEPLKALTSKLKCKRAIPLQVSGAFHSPFMEAPAKAFAKELDKVDFSEATIPVISNSDPIPTCDPIVLKQRLQKQMINGVRWRETMEVFSQQGITRILEIGPGNVLSGLAKRSLEGINIEQLNSAKQLL